MCLKLGMLPNMSERSADWLGGVLLQSGDYWQAFSANGAAQWAVMWHPWLDDDDDEPTELGPLGIVLWGDNDPRGIELNVSSARIPWATLSLGLPVHYPTWEQYEPPSADQIRRGWEATAPERNAWVRAQRRVTKPRTRLARRDGESADAFYARVARVYEAALSAGNGKPTMAVADAAGIDNAKAGQWVHAARKRGHLPPTRPGKAKATKGKQA